MKNLIFIFTHLRVCLVLPFLAGCGTVVPSLVEPGEDRKEEGLFVRDLVHHIHCSLKTALRNAIVQDQLLAKGKITGFKENNGRLLLKWIYSWGVQINLNLTVSEKSTFNPTISVVSPFKNATRLYGDGDKVVTGQQRSLGLGFLGSSEATRIDKIYSFYRVSDLVANDPVTCSQSDDRHGHSFLFGDLGIPQWLANSELTTNTQDLVYASDTKGPFKQNVLIYETKFDVTTVGNVTPQWKLVDTVVNSGSAPFLEARRQRVHDLTITMGPADESGKDQLSLTPLLASAAADVGTNVGISLRAMQGQ